MRDIQLRFKIEELDIILELLSDLDINNDVEYQLFARFEKAFDDLKKLEVQ